MRAGSVTTTPHPLLRDQPGQLPRRPGDLADAEALERETIARLRKTLGPEHPDTLACQANLAVTLHEAGRDQEAERLREQMLADFGRVLGPGHPNAVRLRNWQRISRDLEPQPI